MPQINDKEIVWRDKFPSAIWWNILPKLSKLQGLSGVQMYEQLDWSTVVTMVQGTVASWELDGDPAIADDIGKLDLFDELLPLLAEIGKLIKDRQPGESPGEAESEPTSQ